MNKSNGVIKVGKHVVRTKNKEKLLDLITKARIKFANQNGRIPTQGEIIIFCLERYVNESKEEAVS